MSSPISCTEPWMWFPSSHKICHEYTASTAEISLFISRKTSVLFSMTQRNCVTFRHITTACTVCVLHSLHECVRQLIKTSGFLLFSQRYIYIYIYIYIMLISLSSRVWHHVVWNSPSTRRNMLVPCFTYTLKTEAPHPLETLRTTHQNTQRRNSAEHNLNWYFYLPSFWIPQCKAMAARYLSTKLLSVMQRQLRLCWKNGKAIPVTGHGGP
jgi:hypothetical protein